MNRVLLRQLARERLGDAEELLKACHWSGAYYLAGYAAECGLKACVCRRVNQDDFPDKDLAHKSYTHNLELLVETALLTGVRKTAIAADPALGRYWLALGRWSEQARYQLWAEAEARELVSAVADPTHGVLQWIAGH